MTRDLPPPRSTLTPMPNTSWMLLEQIHAGEAETRRELLADLLARYWKPIYAYYRSKGKSRADAEDLVQGFLFHLAGKPELLPRQEQTPRFRGWLLTCARNYLIQTLRRDNADKRRPPQALLSLAALEQNSGPAYEPAAGDGPEQAFQDAWRRDLLQQALDAVLDEAAELGRGQDVQIFLDYFAADGGPTPTWRELADRHRLTHWKQAFNKAEWVKRRLARAIRELVRAYINSDDEIEAEIRDLLS